MEIIQNIFGSLTRLLVIVGAGVSTVSICFAAFQWMTAQGDPQGVNKARMGLMGAVGGLILVGTAFIIPRVIGETVIEQVGGVSGDRGVVPGLRRTVEAAIRVSAERVQRG